MDSRRFFLKVEKSAKFGLDAPRKSRFWPRTYWSLCPIVSLTSLHKFRLNYASERNVLSSRNKEVFI